jgi:transposase
MGKATGLAYRERIIALQTEGYTLQAISQELGLTYSNVRDICHRYRREGLAGLSSHYARCGPPTRRCSPVVYRAALWLKRLHPRWGSPRLQAGLKSHYQDQTPSIRSLNRWFRQSNLIKPRSKIATLSVGASRAVHNIWQVDAKENLTLGKGQAGCYLTVTDEKSGAWLASLVFPLQTHLPSASLSSQARTGWPF